MAMEDMPSVPTSQELLLAKLLRGGQPADPAQALQEMQQKHDMWAALGPAGQRQQAQAGQGVFQHQLAMADSLMQPSAKQHTSVGGAIGAGLGDVAGAIGGGLLGNMAQGRQTDAALGLRGVEDLAQQKLLAKLLGGQTAPGQTQSTPYYLQAGDPNRSFNPYPYGE